MNYNQLCNVLNFIISIKLSGDIFSMSPGYLEEKWDELVSVPFSEFRYIDINDLDRLKSENIKEYYMMWSVYPKDQNHILGILSLLLSVTLNNLCDNEKFSISDLLELYDTYIGSYNIKKQENRLIRCDHYLPTFLNKECNEYHIKSLLRAQTIDDVLE